MKKKIRWIALLMALFFTVAMPAYAENTESAGRVVITNKEKTIPVNAKIRLKALKQNVYKVDIEWGSMAFTYTPRWNPDSHAYEHSDESWSCEKGANGITVTNHSSAEVEVNLKYVSEDEAVSGSFTESGQVSFNTALAAASETGAPSLTAYLALSGELTATEAETQVVGNVTVTISQP